MAHSCRNGLWVAVELAPYSVVGGLGQVSETIPEALNQHLDKDMRVIVPMLAGMVNHPDFQQTDWTVTLPTALGQNEIFTIYQRTLPGKPVVYALANETFFAPHPNLYFKKTESPKGIGKDAIFKSMMLFNRAAALFADKLNTVSQESNPQTQPLKNTVQPFSGPVDFVMVHDWLSAPFLNEMPKGLSQSVGKVFMLHNTYNEARPVDVAQVVNGMKPEAGQKVTEKVYSPLRLGIAQADAVVANHHYAQRVAFSLNRESNFALALQKKLSQGSVFDMHHGLSNRYDPFNNPALKTDGFTPLDNSKLGAWMRQIPDLIKVKAKAPPSATQEMVRFKTQNRLALQKELGLVQNPSARVFSWIARPEPYQKGFYMVLDEIHGFLKGHPEAQVVLAGPQPQQGNPEVDAFIQQLQGDPTLSGRVALLGFVSPQTIVRIHAGSDFLMHPSLYEPYGLSQLEAMTLGSLPIVNGVDGLRSTVSDPRRNEAGDNGEDGKEAVRAYGQNGVVMKPFSALRYWKGLDERLKGLSKTTDAQRGLKLGNQHFRQALERAWTLAKKETPLAQARLNGLRYVTQRHTWEVITPRYNAPIEAAIAKASQRRMGTATAAKFA